MSKSKLIILLLAAAFVTGCATQPATGAKPAAAAAVDDAAIAAKVNAALASDPETSALKIKVESSQGVVTLKGEVKTFALRTKVENLAKGVAGVKSVNNQLVITG